MSASTLVDAQTIATQTELAIAYSVDYNVSLGTDCSFVSSYSNATPSGKAFASAGIDTSANTLTLTSHGLTTGIVGQFTTSSALPAGITALTDYYIIRIDANTIKLATSLANATAGTPVVDITTQGTGNQTFTATTSAGNVLKLQQSADGSTFFDVAGATVTISTSSGNALWAVTPVTTVWYRVTYTPSAGAITFTTKVNLFNRTGASL